VIQANEIGQVRTSNQGFEGGVMGLVKYRHTGR